jgi:multiple sugar transport system ATP-binding protein
MASINLRNIVKSFGETKVLRDVSLEICDGEFTALVGPSGCGKSTLLRVLAGLEDFDGGSVSIDNVDVSDASASERNLSMVFQSYALYPHLTVRENIAVPLRMRELNSSQRLPFLGSFLTPTPIKRNISDKISAAAKMLEIDHLLERKPGQLSGGQRQRVALGRALVRKPKAFLLDEPLSNLDAKLRVQTRSEIAQLHQQLRSTFVYVTHDQVEAMTMANRIAVMKDGKILQYDTPENIYNKPSSVDVAEFIGSPKINIFPAALINPNHGSKLQLGVRPENIKLNDGSFRLQANISYVENLGPEIQVQFKLSNTETQFYSRFDAKYLERLPVGNEAQIGFNEVDCHLFDNEGRRLEPSKSRQFFENLNQAA